MAQTAHSGLARLFGRPAIQVPAEENNENKEEDLGYKQTNHSLVNKNIGLKAEITKLKKRIQELHEENLRKDEKIAILEGGVDKDKIDLLVAERFKRKMSHMNTIIERSIMNMSRSAEEMRAVMGEMMTNVVPNTTEPSSLPPPLQPKTTVTHPKALNLVSKPTMARIQESPLVSERKRPSSVNEPATPKTANITIRRTPKTGRKVEENPINATPNRRVRSTPTRPAATTLEGDTVRRKRAAASKITSLAEPSLNTKLRRPGKYDEPTPHISTDFI